MAARLKEFYQKKVVPALTQEHSYKNTMAVPKIEKISLNVGMGEATQNSKLIDGAMNELTAIAGQKPIITKARKSIAASNPLCQSHFSILSFVQAILHSRSARRSCER